MQLWVSWFIDTNAQFVTTPACTLLLDKKTETQKLKISKLILSCIELF